MMKGEITLRGSRLDSGGILPTAVFAPDNSVLAADAEGNSTCPVGTRDCKEFTLPGGAEIWDGKLRDPTCGIACEVPSLINGGETLGKCFMFVITISANISGCIFVMRISSDPAPLSPSASKAPIIAIICSAGVNSLSNAGTFGGSSFTDKEPFIKSVV